MDKPLELKYQLVTIIGNMLPEEPIAQKYQYLEEKLPEDQVPSTAKYFSEEYLKTMTAGLKWAMICGIISN